MIVGAVARRFLRVELAPVLANNRRNRLVRIIQRIHVHLPVLLHQRNLQVDVLLLLILPSPMVPLSLVIILLFVQMRVAVPTSVLFLRLRRRIPFVVVRIVMALRLLIVLRPVGDVVVIVIVIGAARRLLVSLVVGDGFDAVQVVIVGVIVIAAFVALFGRVCGMFGVYLGWRWVFPACFVG